MKRRDPAKNREDGKAPTGPVREADKQADSPGYPIPFDKALKGILAVKPDDRHPRQRKP